jgi:hypothetical protein
LPQPDLVADTGLDRRPQIDGGLHAARASLHPQEHAVAVTGARHDPHSVSLEGASAGRGCFGRQECVAVELADECRFDGGHITLVGLNGPRVEVGGIGGEHDGRQEHCGHDAATERQQDAITH